LSHDTRGRPLRSAKASEMYLTKTRPSTTCLPQVGRVHVAAHLVGRLPQLLFEAQVGAVGLGFALGFAGTAGWVTVIVRHLLLGEAKQIYGPAHGALRPHELANIHLRA
jgi:hypothetical protein